MLDYFGLCTDETKGTRGFEGGPACRSGTRNLCSPTSPVLCHHQHVAHCHACALAGRLPTQLGTGHEHGDDHSRGPSTPHLPAAEPPQRGAGGMLGWAAAGSACVGLDSGWQGHGVGLSIWQPNQYSYLPALRLPNAALLPCRSGSTAAVPLSSPHHPSGSYHIARWRGSGRTTLCSPSHATHWSGQCHSTTSCCAATWRTRLAALMRCVALAAAGIHMPVAC